MIVEAVYTHKPFVRVPLENCSANLAKRAVVEGRWAASRRSSKVQPSWWAAYFFDIRVKVSVTTFTGMQFFEGRAIREWGAMWECLAGRVSFARNFEATKHGIGLDAVGECDLACHADLSRAS